MACLDPSAPVLPILEYLFNGAAKRPGDAKCQCQRWNVSAGFQSNDRLACNADFLPKLCLGHFAMVEAKPSNLICQTVAIIPGHGIAPACECTRSPPFGQHS